MRSAAALGINPVIGQHASKAPSRFDADVLVVMIWATITLHAAAIISSLSASTYDMPSADALHTPYDMRPAAELDVNPSIGQHVPHNPGQHAGDVPVIMIWAASSRLPYGDGNNYSMTLGQHIVKDSSQDISEKVGRYATDQH
ncbi:hypothetical protein BV22DRAFT_1052491 [Leucogyrophana mollusca]|uniref:Uncharacterized protein n=1 Tax=Leucogyrophana mollusca TaxID=85980 RepID=A0ACB8AWK5_9AGAM|nr:hypothetical protein BV22DRAFT_1052491 [Leucogyrophana mollusca]